MTVYPLLIYFSQGKCNKRVFFLSQSSLGSSHDLQPLFCPPSLLWGPNCLRPTLFCLVVATLLSQCICHCWQKICRLSICNHSKISSFTEVLPSEDWGGMISLMRSPELWFVKPDAWFGMSDLLSVTWGLCGWLSVVLGSFLMFVLREIVLLNGIQAESPHWAPTWTQG